MAVALNGGYPDESVPGSIAGQRLAVFERTPGPWLGATFSLADAQAISAVADERLSTSADEARAYAAEPDFDAALVRQSFAHIAVSSGAAMEYFYAHLFVRYPEMRSMFPDAMDEHRNRVFAALERIVWNIDNPEKLTSFLGRLARDHRKFGVKERHFEPVLSVLLDTFQRFCGPYWTEATRDAWEAALGHVTSIMTAAAQADAALQPSWWIGEIVQHDRRGRDLAVLTIRPDQPLRYSPGQYLAVQVPRWPRVWRNFSIANAPRGNGLIDLHVRAVPGGMVSWTLVHHVAPGDTLLLGQAGGEMTAAAGPGRDVLCVAGGTGLAPIKAIIEGLIDGMTGAGEPAGQPGRIGLLLGARTEKDLYDLPAMRELESGCPALTVTPVVSHQSQFTGIKGTLPEAAVQYASCDGKDVFVSGPAAMVRATVSALAGRVGSGQIRYDPADPAG